MKRRTSFRGALAASLFGAACASAAQAEPERYGDRQQGQFGDPGKGFFGDPAAGEFMRYGFVQKPDPESEAARRAREGHAQTPYLLLQRPADPSLEQEQ